VAEGLVDQLAQEQEPTELLTRVVVAEVAPVEAALVGQVVQE
jgi:hypothetical protein